MGPLHSLTSNSTFRALQVPAFRRYFAGQLISISGSWIQRVAQGWLVYELTGSAWWLGVVACAGGIPMLLMGPWAGVAADRWSRRGVLWVAMLAEMIFTLSLAILTFTGLVTPYYIVLFAAGMGVTAAFGEPARQSMMGDLVGREYLNSGLALNSLMVNTASVVGPVLAGMVLPSLGASWCFLLNGVSYSAILIVLPTLQLLVTPRKTKPPTAWRSLLQGWHYILEYKALTYAFILAVAMSSMGSSLVNTMLPAFAREQFGANAQGYAWLNAAMGAGAVVGSTFTVWAGKRWGLVVVARGMAALLPFAVVGLTFTPHLSIASFIMGVLGAGYTLFYVNTNTFLQSSADDMYRGRVMSLWSMNRFGLSPLVSLGLGALAARWGTVSVMRGGAVVSMVLVVGVLLTSTIQGNLRGAALAAEDNPRH